MNNITPIFNLMAQHKNDNDMIAWDMTREYSWSEFCHHINQLTSDLVKHGAQHWLLASENAYGFAVGLLSVLYAGHHLILPANLQPGHLAYLAKSVKGILIDDEKLPIPDHIDSMPIFSNQKKNVISSLPKFADMTKEITLYTSGSSGEPVRCVKPLKYLEAEVATLEKTFGHDQIQSMIASVSPYHIYGLLFRIFWPLLSNRAFATNLIRYPEELMSQTQKKRGLVFISSPAFLKRASSILDLPKLKSDLQGIFSSGGPLEPQTSATFNQVLSHPIVEVYGSTETGGIGYRSVFDPDTPTYWRPFDQVKLNLSEDQRLQVASPHLPSKGWYQTEDLVEFNTQGQFLLKGRADRIVKLEEYRVSLTEIERHLEAQIWIASAYVLPLQGKTREILGAVIVPNERGWQELAKIGKSRFIKNLREKLADHFITTTLPKKWRFLKDVPENAQGKTTQTALKALFHPTQEREILPKILSREQIGNHHLFQLILPKNIIYFDGHFENMPILPGVVQIDWAIRFARIYLSVTGSFQKMESVKFFRPIIADTHVTMDISYDKAKKRLIFSYVNGGQIHSSGRILFTKTS